MAHILVVEDDLDLQFLYEATLGRLGHVVASASRTSEALLMLTHEEFDLVILDMNMPDAPGVKVIEFARGDARLRHVPMIVISADAQWRRPCLDLGIEHFLVKPVPTRRLFALLDEILTPA